MVQFKRFKPKKLYWKVTSSFISSYLSAELAVQVATSGLLLLIFYYWIFDRFDLDRSKSIEKFIKSSKSNIVI